MLASHRLPDADAVPAGAPATLLDGTSVFFDLDGTLIDIAATPDGVVVSPDLLAALDRLVAAAPGRVAVLSGRSLDQLDHLLGRFARRVAVAGSHGAEIRLAGQDARQRSAPPALAAATRALRDVAEAHGLLLEEKSMGTALHYRHAPGREAIAASAAAVLADRHGLVLQRGKMMVELRAPGDKGDALCALLREEAMVGTRPLFFGDDVTDEDGFVAATRAGGAGVLVGPARASAARYRLDDPAAVRRWIDAATVGAA